MSLKMKIRTKMLTAFLALGIVPLSITGGLLFFYSGDAMTHLAFGKLESIREVKKAQLQEYFSERENDTVILAETVESLGYAAFEKLTMVQENKLAQIREYFKRVRSDAAVISSNAAVIQALEDFESTMSAAGRMDTEGYRFFDDIKYGGSMSRFKNEYGYHDILLISKEGTVVYSANREADLGQNLIKGSLKHSGLGIAFQEGLSSGIGIHDFEVFPPSGNRAIAFVGAPIIRDNDTLGVLVLALDSRAVNTIARRGEGVGKTGETLIAGRSPGGIECRTQWRDQESGREAPFTKELLEACFLRPTRPRLLSGSDGSMKIVRSDSLGLPGLDWVMISVMDLKEAIAPKFKGGGKGFLENYIGHDNFTNLFIISADGIVVFAVDPAGYTGMNLKDSPPSAAGLAELFERVSASHAYEFIDFLQPCSSGCQPYAFIGQPVIFQGRVELIVALKLPIDAVNAIMKQRNGLGKTGETYLVGPDGRMRSDSYLTPGTHSFVESFANPEQGKADTLSSRAALAGETGNMITNDYRGVEVLSAYTPIPVGAGTTWALLAELDKDEALGSLLFFKRVFAVAAIITLSSILAVSYGVARHFARPIDKLTMAAEKVAEKHFDISVAVHTNDEMEKLATAFNTMIRTIQRYSRDIEGKVVLLEKTEEKVRESEERFRQIFENINVGIAIYETRDDGNSFIFKDINPYGARSGETARENHIGRNVLDVYPAVKEIGLFDVFREVWLTGQSRQHPISLYRDDKVTLWVENYVSRLPSGEVMAVYDDLTSKRKAEDALRESEQRYRSVYETAPLAFVVWDIECRILKWNDQAQTMFGWTRAEAIGKNFLDLIIPDEDRPWVEQVVDKLLKGIIEKNVINKNMTKDGRIIWCEWNNTIIRDADGKISTALSLGLDITNRISAEKELNEYREHLEDLVEQRTTELELKNKELETFTYSVSHDLKAPLRGIDGYSRLLTEEHSDKLDQEGLRFLSNIRQSAEKMNQLIEDLLVYSRMERRDIQPAILDLKSLMDRLIIERAHELETGKIGLSVNIPFQSVEADMETLRQVMGNYLDNAVKFSQKGVKAVVEVGGRENEDSWTLWVKDNGIGFDRKYCDRIFDIFQRLHRAEDYPGTGVGLAIVRRAAGRLGGRVWARSDPGRGSTFFVDIPKVSGLPEKVERHP